MDEDYIKLRDAAPVLERAESSLRRDCQAGKYRAKLFMNGKKPEWRIHKSELGEGDYGELHKRWVQEMGNGYHTGKRLSPSGIDSNVYGLLNYWKFLGKSACIAELTPDNLRRALSSVEPDHKKRNCFYSKRKKMYQGFRSFFLLLVREGLKQEGELLQTKAFAPKQIYEPQRTFIEDADDYEKLLRINDTWLQTRTEFDQVLMRTYLVLSYETGMRRSEIINLLVEDVNLKLGVIHITDGKGHMSRRVGISPALEAQIKDWIAYRPKSEFKNLLLQKSGQPLTKKVINPRVQRLSEKAGVRITPHGFRHTFITNSLKEGMPLVLVQKTVGHRNIKTTQTYDRTTDLDAIEYMKRKNQAPEAPVKSTREKLKDLLLSQ